MASLLAAQPPELCRPPRTSSRAKLRASVAAASLARLICRFGKNNPLQSPHAPAREFGAGEHTQALSLACFESSSVTAHQGGQEIRKGSSHRGEQRYNANRMA